MVEEITTFIGKVRDAGQGSLELTIPKNIVEFEGLKAGSYIKVLLRKLEDPKFESEEK